MNGGESQHVMAMTSSCYSSNSPGETLIPKERKTPFAAPASFSSGGPGDGNGRGVCPHSVNRKKIRREGKKMNRKSL